MRDLQRVTSFFVHNGRLYLELPNDSGTMKFRAGRQPLTKEPQDTDTLKSKTAKNRWMAGRDEILR